MRVLVTGAGGFIGSHVVEELLAHGHSVKSFVHYNSSSSIGNLELADLARWEGHHEIVFGDIRDSGCVHEQAGDVEAILHLAALIGIPYSYSAPRSYLDTNALGTLNVLEAARLQGIRRVVVTSTSEVYGTALYSPIDETHPLQAQSPYSASKMAADKLTESYMNSFDLPAVILRPFNTYGPRQSARAVIPTIVAQLLDDRTELSLGSLTPKRDLVFVKDTARAFRLALESDSAIGQTVHFGTGETFSVGQIAELCMDQVGQQKPIVQKPERVRPVESEVQLLVADSTRAGELLGWSPRVGLAEGLQQVIEFVKANRALFKPDRYSV